jgi:hypothetical protein
MISGLIIFTALFCVVTPSYYENAKPNVLFILADDLGYGDLSRYSINSCRKKQEI